MRIPQKEAASLEDLAGKLGVERGTLYKWAVKRGSEDLALEHALGAYRTGEASLSRAAELAGLSRTDFMLRLQSAAVELNYGITELEKDLTA